MIMPNLTSSLDVPIDLSSVLFVCTANVLHTIPRPLLDRLEVIELSGYVAAEKKAIAERFLGPQAREQSGLKDVDVDISPDAVDTIIRWYARESGVRNLKKLIEKVYRKAAFKIVQDLGEEAIPEPTPKAEEVVKMVETQEPDVKPASERTPGEEAPKEEGAEEKPATTERRTPVKVPDNVSIRVTPENLRDYVGA
jgi:Lon-like ATP-dependent protease